MRPSISEEVEFVESRWMLSYTALGFCQQQLLSRRCNRGLSDRLRVPGMHVRQQSRLALAVMHE